MSSNNQQLTSTLFFPKMIWWLGRRKTRVVDHVKMQMSRAWRERSSASIRMNYSTLPKIVVVYKLFHLSNSVYLIFFLLLQFFLLRCFSLLVPPSPETPFFYMYSFSFPGPSLLCWGFARISRCITVVIACRDCLQLSERTSVSVQHWLSLSLSFSWLYFVEFFFFYFLAYSSSSLLVDFLLFCSSRENGGGGGLMAQLIC